MTTALPRTALQLRSLIRPDGELELSLAEIPVPAPNADEVLVRIEASPLNPSDLGLLFGAADMATLKASGTASRPVVKARVPEAAMKAMAGRVGQAMPVGNEGAGVVVAAGASTAAQALLGKTVAMHGGSMYSQYRCLPADECLLLPEGTAPADGASCFINPMTALTMVATMRREGHKAIVHTAAASNLGQMLQRLCQQENIELVNIVRKPEQVQLLRSLGAAHVCDSSSPNFPQELTDVLAATGATLAFDAIGGGKLAGQILACMETALVRTATTYSRYGSPIHKQVYLYGSLDTTPTQFSRSFGMAWGMGGWLVFAYMQKLEAGTMQAFKKRIAAELKTTFASHYTGELSLAQALSLEHIAAYGRRATGAKYLITPAKE
ncbi:MAG: zinc-binding dehydrogenase [Ramlibacter sp.]